MKCLAILLSLVAVVLCHDPFREMFQWKTIDVVWPSEEERLYAVQRGGYIPANNAIAGIKVWKGKIYLTIPRWKDGVPVTLGVIPADNTNPSPKIQAYPSWSMQKLGDCSAFQFVQSMEIDPKGRMWVLDSGRISILSMTNVKTTCKPRLVILDLENNGEVLRTYEFPEDVARPNTVYLNDIVLDHQDGGVAYITDTDREDPGIIVYSLQNNTSWKVRHPSMHTKPEATSFMVGTTHVLQQMNVDGIALSPASSNDRQIYYCPLSSFHLYSVPTWVLKNNSANVDRYVSELGRKNSQTDGMAMSSTGVLYFGLLADDAVAMWNTKETSSFTTGQRVISRDHALMQWPDSFAFDDQDYLWCVTNSLQNLLNNRVNASMPNYRILRTRAGSKSYLFYENGTAPEWPVVTAGADKVTVALAAQLALLLFLVAK